METPSIDQPVHFVELQVHRAESEIDETHYKNITSVHELLKVTNFIRIEKYCKFGMKDKQWCFEWNRQASK